MNTLGKNRYFKAIVAFFLLSFFTSPTIAKAPSDTILPVNGGAGSVTIVKKWQIQTSSKAQEGGEFISRKNYAANDWHTVRARSTVFGGLLENGNYPVIGAYDGHNGNHTDVFVGTRLAELYKVNRNPYSIPWWYRVEFQLPDDNLETHINIKGIIPCADVWVNGTKIANHKDIAGAFTMHTLQVSRLVHPGVNVLAIRVHPANAERNFIQGWIDLNPYPPDRGMGVWRDVEILRTGPISLQNARVTSDLSLPDFRQADITVKTDVHNNTGDTINTRVSGSIGSIAFSKTVHLLPHQTRVVQFDPGTNQGLKLKDPKVWWPARLGDQPLYDLSLAAQVEGTPSDSAYVTFGIRKVTSHFTKQGYRQFVVNGIPLLIRGAYWNPDMFLRFYPKRMENEFRLIRNLGINTLRLGGRINRKELYELADRYGIMIMAGWECCDKWESYAETGGEPWDANDYKIARRSMYDVARLLRNHPSVISFLLGSDNAPPAPIAKMYGSALQEADWPNQIVPSAGPFAFEAKTDADTAFVDYQKSNLTGHSGLKMSGPYGWVPPEYWYSYKRGGAFGFNSETAPGATIPQLDILKKVMTPHELEELWTTREARPFSAEPVNYTIPRLRMLFDAMVNRYGKPTSLEDYVKWAQFDNYMTSRSEFEAYIAHMDADIPATGLINLTLNTAMPSLHANLFGYYLDAGGSFYGAKKANELIHIQYCYDDGAIVTVNHSREPLKNINAHIRIYNLDGSILFDKKLSGIKIPANHTVKLFTTPNPEGLSPVYFLDLKLYNKDESQNLSRNVYWLSTRKDILDWKNSNWYVTPVSQYADFTALRKLPAANVSMSAYTEVEGDNFITTVKLTNVSKSKTVALFQHLSVLQGEDGPVVRPIFWNNNYVTLWPGETITLRAKYAAQLLKDATPVVRLQGMNVASQTLPAKAAP